ncbi:uncharacterized protein LOC125111348 [Phacochoerus africanus]|uniref:uncharacterized protein LOC125111348 n=1 Tax=Phacochoerus africanus TaxID=41426 RepID=UPI001FD9F2F0|nr:uncharacterized protein LOC125111348 [Phacochoerus africanus]
MFNVGASVCNTPGAAASFPPDNQEPLGQRASGSWTPTSEDLSQAGGLLMSSVTSFILPTIPMIAEHLLSAWRFPGPFLAGKESPAVLPAPPAPPHLGPYNLLEEHRPILSSERGSTVLPPLRFKAWLNSAPHRSGQSGATSSGALLSRPASRLHGNDLSVYSASWGVGFGPARCLLGQSLGRSPSLSRGSVREADSGAPSRARTAVPGTGAEKEDQGPRSRSGYEISDTFVSGSFTAARPTLKLKKRSKEAEAAWAPGPGCLGPEVWMRNRGRASLRVFAAGAEAVRILLPENCLVRDQQGRTREAHASVLQLSLLDPPPFPKKGASRGHAFPHSLTRPEVTRSRGEIEPTMSGC